MCSRSKLDSTKLWHSRLGHINYKDLVHLVNTEKVRSMPRLSGEPKPICGECMQGKQTKSPHKKVNEIRTTRPVDLLHMDLIGPMWTKNRGGKRYVIVVVDDFSRYSFMNFLREKFEVIEHLKSLFNRIQVETGHSFVRIRSDGG